MTGVYIGGCPCGWSITHIDKYHVSRELNAHTCWFRQQAAERLVAPSSAEGTPQ